MSEKIKITEDNLAEVCPNWTEYARTGSDEFYLEKQPDGTWKAKAAVSYTYDIGLDDDDVEDFKALGVDLG